MRLLMRQICVLIILLSCALLAIAEEGTLSDNQRIYSTHLGYDLQYRIYRPAKTSADDKLPSLYVTDGQGYLAQGDFKSILDTAIASGLKK